MTGTALSTVRRAALVAAALVFAACGSGGDTAAPDAQRGGGWRPLAASPLSGRMLPATVWTGTEMVLWGGASCDVACSGSVQAHADGAVYDPGDDRWRPIAASPLSPRFGALAVWTGREAVIWGGSAGDGFMADGAAYDPAADRWRLLPPSPLVARFGVPPGTVARVPGVWTGREVIVWGQGAGVDGPEEGLPQGAAYDPAADRWRVVPPAPVLPRITSPVWTGREMLLWGGQSGRSYFDDGAAYDPAADSWRALAAAPLAARFTFASWSGTEMLVWGGESGEQAFDDGAAYDPAGDRWRRLAPTTLAARRGFAHVWTERELLIWGGAPGTGRGFLGNGAAYDPSRDQWRDVGPRRAHLLPASVWTGREVLLWGGIVFTDADRIGTSNEGARLAP